MRVVNFAHGSLAMLGGYALFFLYTQYHVPYAIAVPLAALVVATLSLVLERMVYRWFYQKMFQSMIGLIGLDMALYSTAAIIWGPNERSIPSPVSGIYHLGPLFLSSSKLVIIFTAAATLLAFFAFTHLTRQGLAMRAAAQDVETAELQGIHTDRIYILAFFIAIFMAALAGGLYAQNYTLSPFMGERPLMMAFVAVILGGMGSIPGVALGGIILGMTESFVGTYFGSTTSTFVTFGAVILILIVRPWGLLGTPEAS
jgi:branched-chain amino acid transport system permease protein